MTLINRLFDLLLAPFSGAGPWAGMAVLSLLAAVLILVIFKITSRQAQIRRKKDLALAALLELALFRDYPRLSMAAFGRVLLANLRYLREMLIPLLATLLPLTLIMIEVHACLGHRPLRKGEAALVVLKFPAQHSLLDQTVSLSAPAGINVETDAVRAPVLNESAWRIRADAEGVNVLKLNVNGVEFSKSVLVHSRQLRVSTARLVPGFWNRLGEPSEPPLPKESLVHSVSIQYPPCSYTVMGLDLGWFWSFCLLALLFAFVLRKPMGVEI